MTTREKAVLKISDEVVALIRKMHPHIKANIKLALNHIAKDPYCGKSLKSELNGLKSYRVKRYRIIYRIGKKGIIEIIAIGPRKYIYEDTFQIINKKQK